MNAEDLLKRRADAVQRFHALFGAYFGERLNAAFDNAWSGGPVLAHEEAILEAASVFAALRVALMERQEAAGG
jgi:hypothetical protein